MQVGPKNSPIKRALLSVSDKSGLIEFAKTLVSLGVRLISTGGTSNALREAGLAVDDVSEVTGFPEIMDGRVKTLHPKVHGGLLAIRGDAAHKAVQTAHGIEDIDLLVVNLYPFEQAVACDAPADEVIENIDVGGPAMIRAAAKNHASVTVVVDPGDYARVAEEMAANSGATLLATRAALAAKAYARTAAYDTAIAHWFDNAHQLPTPQYFTVGGPLIQTLRYGENPHQVAAAYKTSDHRFGILDATQMQGKELSYNNINDADAALEAVSEFPASGGAACVIVKHANPCGVAVAPTAADAYRKALACDPTSAFGGIIAFNRPITGEAAMEITKIFTEVILAPGIDEDALQIFRTKKSLRLLLLKGMPDPGVRSTVVKSIAGGLLVQTRDNAVVDEMTLTTVTRRTPTADEIRDLRFAFQVVKHVKSNAVVFAKQGSTIGIGAGQMSRIDSTRIAAQKSLDASVAQGLPPPRERGFVLASDAFFPFPDGVEAAAAAGATAIIQPGGSLKDEAVIAAADKAGIAMVFTRVRHFRH